MWSSRKRLVLETKLQKPREDDSGGDHKGEWQREKRTHFTETQSDGLNALSSLLPLNIITLRTCLPSYNRQNLATLLCYLSICIIASLQDPPLRFSASCYLHLCVFPSHIESSSSLWPREDYQNDQVWFLRISPERHCNFCFGLLTLKWPAVIPGELMQPSERSMCWGTETSLQQPTRTCQPCEWTTLEMDL